MKEKKVTIKITLSQFAAEFFKKSGINPLDYGTAYGGESAGLDLYNMGPEIIFQSNHVWTALGSSPMMIPTGVFVALPENSVAFIKERSSIVKTSLMSRAGVIDPGYTGEIFVNLVNLGMQKISIPTGSKLPVQLVAFNCLNKYQVVGYDEYLSITQKSKRDQGSLGSSDNQQGD